MFVSLDWVKDFVKLPEEISGTEILNKFTMTTAEVEDVKVIGEFWKKIKIAEITDITSHPQADKLNLVTFNFGASQTAQVVCGADNVKVGLKTAYAPIGTTLPIGFTLEPKKIRGILSEGMLCSDEELGLAQKSSGIIEFPDDVVVGMTLKEYYKKQEDIIIDIDNKSLTHRPDLWGQYGMAREFAALYKKKLIDPFNEDWKQTLEKEFNDFKPPLTVKVDSDSAGICYWGLSIDNITIKESPHWLKQRLIGLGLRPINNIVDISNYVMLELGLPLHIFDRQQISGETIFIKRIADHQKFMTLDDVERNLVPGDTVIHDENQPLVIAGIMGGKSSGVEEKTTKLFIEVANWNSSEIRKMSTRLGLRTDSSQRFEKSLDSILTYKTLLRTIDLIKQLCPQAKVAGKPVYDGIDLSSISKKIINIEPDFARKVLGSDIADQEMVDILERLDFKVEKSISSTSFDVEVPSFRATKDVECDADLIEELGRFIGYDNIIPSSPLLDISPVRRLPKHIFQEKLRNFLVYNCKSHEVMTSPLIGEKIYQNAKMNYDNVLSLVNSISNDRDAMRDSFIPSMLNIAKENSKNFNSFRLFELGRVYLPNKKSFSSEHEQLVMINYSKSNSVFIESVNNFDRLLNQMNLTGNLMERGAKFTSSVIDETWEGLHPQEYFNFQIMGKMNASVFSIHPFLLQKLKIKGHLTMTIFDYQDISKRQIKDKIKYHPISKTPVSNFDYTVTLDSKQSLVEVLLILKKIKRKEIIMNKVVDIFKDQNSERKHITFRSIFDGGRETLSTKFISELEHLIVHTLENNNIFLKKN